MRYIHRSMNICPPPKELAMSRRILATTSRTRPELITSVVCLALAAVVAPMASLNAALPDLARVTHATQTQLVWVIAAYSLAFAALLLPGGAIGDRFGRRLALIAGLATFGCGSALAIISTSATELIALRTVLGLGAALVMPATLSTITSTFPPAQRARAVSIWAAVAGGAAILGLLASGALLAVLSWRSIFALNVVLACVALLGVVRFVPESAARDAAPLDVGGAMLAALALVALVFSVIEAPDQGWLATRTVGGLGVAVLLLAGFVIWELRQATPLLDPRLFRDRPLTAGSSSILVQFFAFYGYTFVVLQYLQLVRRDSPLLAAVQVLPVAATMMLTSRLAPRLTARFGRRVVCTIGLTLIAAGLAIVAQLSSTSPYWLMAIGLVVLGVGMGAATTPATSAITEALPPAQQGVGSALNDLSREVGGALGIAVIGSILTGTYSNRVNVAGLSSELAAKVKQSFAVAAHLTPPIPNRASAAFLTAMHLALLTAAGAALMAAVVVTLLLAKSSRSPAAEHGANAPANVSSVAAVGETEPARGSRDDGLLRSVSTAEPCAGLLLSGTVPDAS
jgi:EmrB/QacA subfamily drug resistance transporter